jgi:hypothetical protein
MLAYLGRYAHQPVTVTLGLTVRQLIRLTEATSEIVKDENTPSR